MLGSALFLVCSCAPDDDPANVGTNEEQHTTQKDPHAKDEYYVRYTAKSSSAFQSSVVANFFYAGENGSSISYRGKGLNVNIEPVKYGFKAFVSVTSGGLCKTKIEVSKNNGPFAQKVDNNSSSASYTINF